jgi:hypothetical protein
VGLCALAVTALVAVSAGCDDPGDGATETTRTTTPARVNERREAREAAVDTVVTYCRRQVRYRQDATTSGRPSRGQMLGAARAVDELVAAVPAYAGSSYRRQLPVRRLLVDLADFLEREDCLRRLVPRVDRAARQLALPDPPEPVEADVPDEEAPEYP